MNRDICDKCSKPIELCDCPTGTTYDLLRRQHEAIKQLRETLETISNYVGKSNPPSRIWVRAEKALKDTEGL